MNKLLSYYTSLFGASGREGDVRRAIINEITPYADSVRTDALGNVIAFKRGKYEPPATVMLSAHMDEVGLIVTSITEDGYLKFDTLGGIDARTLYGKQVMIGKGKLYGVIGQMAPHLLKKSDDSVKDIEELCIDIGAKDREDAEKYASVGDVVGFRSDYAEFGNNLVRAKALDDRIGCTVLTNVIKCDLPFDTWFAFTVMEEVGCIGAGPAAFSIKPDYSIVVEGTTAADISDDKSKSTVANVGDGPTISFMDGATVYDREFINLAISAAKENSIPYQMKQAVAGGNDSSRIQRTGSGCSALAISVAVRYLHTPMGVASLDDIEQTEKLVLALLDKLSEI